METKQEARNDQCSRFHQVISKLMSNVCLSMCLSVLGVDSMFGGPGDSLGSGHTASAAAAPQTYVDAIRSGLDPSAQEQGW